VRFRNLRVLVSIFALTSLVSCTKIVFDERVFIASDRYSFSGFVDSIDEFPFVAGESRFSTVLNGYSRLSKGMTKEEVIAEIGEPDSEMIEYQETDSSREFVGSTFGYYLSRSEKELANLDLDQQLTLYFDSKHVMYYARPENIDGLKDIGSILSSDR